jgi:hypothetical protein
MLLARLRSLAALTLGVLSAASLTVGSAHAGTSAGPSPMMLPAYAHGSITGAGPRNGVRLMLIAWPKQSVMGEVRVGQHVKTRVIGRATSSNTGTYSIRPTVQLKNGLVNLEVVGRSSEAVGASSFGAMIHGKTITPAAAGSLASKGPVPANIRMIALPKSAGPAVPQHPGIPLCPPPVKIRELGRKMVDIGGLYSIGMPHAKISMTYSDGSTTTIGVAVSVPFSDNSFSAGGTFTETKSGEEGIPAQTGVEENMQTPYTFGEYSLCGGLMHQTQPEEWVTGAHGVTVLAPKAERCSAHFPAGDTFSTADEKAGTFTAGVDLKHEIGINLSAQSGYDKDTSITWTFPKSGGFLCGTNNLPPKAAWNVMDVSKSGNPLP